MTLRAELNGRNKIEAINGLSVPVVQYSFGIIGSKISELKRLTKKHSNCRTCTICYILKQMWKGCTSREKLEEARGLIEGETAFKTATIGLDHYLKDKEGQYPKQLLEHERSKAKNPITKNATKFKREVAMPEFENREDKSPAENAKA